MHVLVSEVDQFRPVLIVIGNVADLHLVDQRVLGQGPILGGDVESATV